LAWASLRPSPARAQSLYLAVPDIEAARNQLLAHGVEVGEVFHEEALGARFHDPGRLPGPAPNRDYRRQGSPLGLVAAGFEITDCNLKRAVRRQHRDHAGIR
jgi:hypothetical protein